MIYFDPLTIAVNETDRFVNLLLRADSVLPEDTTIRFTFTDGSASGEELAA